MSDAIATVEFQLADLDAEPHVVEALRLAASLSAGPCSAGDVLLAVVLNSASAGSKAFQAFRSYLPGKLDAKVAGTGKIESVRLTSKLSESWTETGFWTTESPRIWGRDLITIALLAEHDPTLAHFCVDAGVPIDFLQDQWFRYLFSNTNRENPPDYRKIWESVNVPIPEMRLQGQYPNAYLATLRAEVPAGPRHPINFSLVGNRGYASVDGLALINRQYLKSGDKIYLMAGNQAETRIIDVGTVYETAAASFASQADPSTPLEFGIEWHVVGSPNPDHIDAADFPPIVDHPTLLAVDEELATWSWKTTGLRLHFEVERELEYLCSDAILETASSPTPEILHYAKTLSDLDHKNDWIGIRPDVEALSTLVAVDQVKPPLSVAIFGDWGSGKTFLLRKIQERVSVLEQLGKKTEALREAARDNGGPEAPHYCGSILQIEFNAWHYTESNLWASLVNTIFERIYDTLNANKTDTDTSVDELFKNFETARHARQAAEEETERLSSELEAAETATTTASDDADAARRHLADIVARNVWTRLDEVIKGEEGEHPEQVEKLQQAFAHFGFKQALTSAQTINDTVSRFQSVSGRAREVFGSLLATPRGIVGAVVVAVVVAAVAIVSRASDLQVSSLGAAIAASLAWLAERGAMANKWVDQIESFSNWFAAEKQQAESAHAAEIETARADLELKQAELLAAKQREQEAARHESRAKAELESLTARDQMRRFVDERVTSRAYAQHLGLVSMIRSDFEELTRFMNREQETEEIELVERIKATTDDVALDSIPTIDRIVLYIDDLDRCQPDRVVEVLEAIHLLLAFRLFIVIVAVDPRWVLESLTQKYAHLSRARSGIGEPEGATIVAPAGSGYHTAATAHDYLEKIFHIPFWVKPMTPIACEKLIEGFLDLHSHSVQLDSSATNREEERFHSLQNVDVEDVARSAAQANAGPAANTAASDDDGEREKPASAPTRTPAAMLKAEKDRRHVEETAAAAAHIETVVISKNEETFIRQLAPYLGNSPRRVKRFANSYRLIKSGLSRAESDRLGTSNDHCIVLAFLAVVTGAPKWAPWIFVEILKNRAIKLDLKDIVAGIKCNDDPAEQQEVLAAKGALGLLNGYEINQDQVEMWVPRVIRHAFRMIPGSFPIEDTAEA